MTSLPHHAKFAPYLENADHVDVKTIESDRNLREFMAAMFGYMPTWMQFLYRVRAVFVRFLGMRQDGVPSAVTLAPEDISFTPGERAAFFTVEAAEEEAYYLASAKESHLDAYLGISVEPLSGNTRRYHMVTIVHYNKWTGPAYFNVIRPFHHLVVRQMLRAAAGEIGPTLKMGGQTA